MPSAVLEGRKSFGKVYCTLCTRTVEAEITIQPRAARRDGGLHATSGQKCPRCAASLDAAFVIVNSLARTA